MTAKRHISSVAFTCDFLRVRFDGHSVENFQNRNLAWLVNLIDEKNIAGCFGVKTAVISAPSDAAKFRSALENKAVFSRYVEDADLTWASLYDHDAPAVFPKIFGSLEEYDLVIGLELPPTVKRAIHRAGNTYMSFHIHPVRFLRDLCFFITTNSKRIASLVAECEVSQHEVEAQVRRYRALFYRLRLPALSIPDDVPVLIGQTERDSVLVRDGRFLSWDNYDDEIAEKLALHSDAVLLEHPYRLDNRQIAEYFRGRHGKTILSVRANSYGILFSPVQTPFYLTLASSLGVEAQNAGKECTFLVNDPRKSFLVKGLDIPRTPMVSHVVLQDAFWKRIITPEQVKRKTGVIGPQGDFNLGDHYIRNSLDSWAFGALQHGINLGSVRKVIVPSASLAEERLHALHNVLRGAALDADVDHAKQTEMPWGTVEVLPKAFALGDQATINFSQDSAASYLAEGFHTIEKWGVWSSGKYSRLIIPVDMGRASEVELAIILRLKMFGGLLAHTPVLQILADGRQVGYVLFRESTKNLEIGFSLRVTKSPCLLEFFISHTGSPATITQSTDHRELGFGLRTADILVSSVQKDKTGKVSTAHAEKFWGLSGRELISDGS